MLGAPVCSIDMSVKISLLSRLGRKPAAKERFTMTTLAGGTGLVGKSLTQALMRDGEQVRVLTRDPTTAAAAFGDAKLEIVGVHAITRDNLYAMPSPTIFDLTGHPHVRSRSGCPSTSRCSPHHTAHNTTGRPDVRLPKFRTETHTS
jgi:hypothetical protein